MILPRFYDLQYSSWVSFSLSHSFVFCCDWQGHAHSFDDVIIDGDVDEQKFTAYYVK